MAEGTGPSGRAGGFRIRFTSARAGLLRSRPEHRAAARAAADRAVAAEQLQQGLCHKIHKSLAAGTSETATEVNEATWSAPWVVHAE